jgi:hypothetical protein
MRLSKSPRQTRTPRGIWAVGIFLCFATVAATFAGFTLLWPGTALDRLWSLNPRAYRDLAPFGSKAGIPFLLLAGVLAFAAFGWSQRRRWGWRLTVGVIAVQLLGDCANLFLGRFVQGGIGVVIAGALLFYLFRRDVKGCF